MHFGMHGDVVSGCLAENAKIEESNGIVRPYLGVGVEPLHRPLITQLLELIGDGRGILVAEVAAGSPAKKAGLKHDDVLISYDDQKMYSPEQLLKLVYNDEPGREVTLGVIHAGKSEKIVVSLGEYRVAASGQTRTAMRSPSPGRAVRPLTAEEQEARWGTFDAMTLIRSNEKYETALKADKFVLIVHGSTAETARARDILSRTSPEAVEHHQPEVASAK